MKIAVILAMVVASGLVDSGVGQDCDCEYRSGGTYGKGCIITKPAQPNSACQCIHHGGTLCRGYTSPCADPNSPKCKNPDTSLASCLEWKSDKDPITIPSRYCGGYKYACNCDYYSGGCKIVEQAPPNTACQCSYYFLWSCNGYVRRCSDTSHAKCINPDTSKASCGLGQGDCGAY